MLSRVQLCSPMDCSLPGSSSHGMILQAIFLEWVAISFSRGSSWPRDQIQVSCIAGRHFTVWATREVCHHLEIDKFYIGHPKYVADSGEYMRAVAKYGQTRRWVCIGVVFSWLLFSHEIGSKDRSSPCAAFWVISQGLIFKSPNLSVPNMLLVDSVNF